MAIYINYTSTGAIAPPSGGFGDPENLIYLLELKA